MTRGHNNWSSYSFSHPFQGCLFLFFIYPFFSVFCSHVLSYLLFRKPFFVTLAHAAAVAAHMPDHIMTIHAPVETVRGLTTNPWERDWPWIGSLYPDLISIIWRLMTCGPLPTRMGQRSGLWERSIGGSLKEGASYREENDSSFSSLVHLPLLSKCLMLVLTFNCFIL